MICFLIKFCQLFYYNQAVIAWFISEGVYTVHCTMYSLQCAGIIIGCDAVTALWSVFDVCGPVVSNVIRRMGEFQVYSVHWSNLFLQHIITVNEWISLLFCCKKPGALDLLLLFKFKNSHVEGLNYLYTPSLNSDFLYLLI